MGHQRRSDDTNTNTNHELSSFDILGGLPSFPATTTLDSSLLHPPRSSRPPYAGALEGEAIAIAPGAVRIEIETCFAK